MLFNQSSLSGFDSQAKTCLGLHQRSLVLARVDTPTPPTPRGSGFYPGVTPNTPTPSLIQRFILHHFFGTILFMIFLRSEMDLALILDDLLIHFPFAHTIY